MSETPDLDQISEQQLETFKRCQFVHRVFRAHECHRSVEPIHDFITQFEERGDELLEDAEKFEVIEGGWDHEHCDLCSAKIVEGVAYWPNESEDAGDVDLCEACYPRIMKLLGRT